MNVTLISGDNYLNFDLELAKVCQEGGRSYAKLDTANPAIQRAFGRSLRFPVQNLTENLPNLYGYLAANRAGLHEEADKFLLAEREKMNKRVAKKLKKLEGCRSEKELSFGKLEEAIEKAVQKSLFPKMTTEEVKVLSSKLPPLVADHLEELLGVNDVEAACARLASALADEGLSLAAQNLLYRHGKQLTTLKIPPTGPKKGMCITNDNLKFILEIAINLTSLNIQGCTNITQEAFANGHQRLSFIDITGTQLRRSDFKNEEFPQLERVISPAEEQFINLTTLTVYSKFERDPRNVTDKDWKVIRRATEKCNKIDTKNLDCFRQVFQHHPTKEGLKVMENLLKHVKKEDFTYGRDQNIIRAVLASHKNACEMKLMFLIAKFCMVYGATNQNTCDEVSNVFAKALTDFYPYCEKDLLWLYALLQACQEYTWPDLNKRVQGEVIRRINDKTDMIFTLQTGTNKRSENADAIEKLVEVLVALSPQINVTDFHRLLHNPIHATKQVRTSLFGKPAGNSTDIYADLFSESKTVKAGPHYGEPTDHMLAAALVMSYQSQDELYKVLHHILKNFQGYPLAKLLVGAVKEGDVPVRNRSGFVARRLNGYAGLFCDPKVGPEMKEAFFKAILAGNFTNDSKELCEVLARLDGQVDENQKVSIYEQLKELELSKDMATKEAAKNAILAIALEQKQIK